MRFAEIMGLFAYARILLGDERVRFTIGSCG